MALPARRRTTNIRRSVQVYMGNALTTAGGNVYPIVYGAPGGVSDPDDAGDDNTSPLRGWAEVTWPIEGAGKRLASIMQVDVYYRFGARSGGAGSDPYRQEAMDIVDAVAALFSGTVPGGQRRCYVPLLDFTVPAAPTPIGECVVCVSTRGDYGEAESVQDLAELVDQGLWHVLARWRFQLTQDLAGPAAFYTG